MRPKASGLIQKVKDKLTAAFSIVDMGSISFYLGLKVERDQSRRTIILSQPVFINKVLEKYHLNKANTVNTPIKKTEPLMPKTNGKIFLSESETY